MEKCPYRDRIPVVQQITGSFVEFWCEIGVPRCGQVTLGFSVPPLQCEVDTVAPSHRTGDGL
jgi:hypothetical protein